MTRSRVLALSFVTVLSFACSSSSGVDAPAPSAVDPIVGGKPDPKDDAVVAIDVGGQGLCSGTLIDARHVLTARHCVSATVESVACPSKAPQVGADRDPRSLLILVGADVHAALPVARGARLLTPASHMLCDHDLAVIELDRPVTSVKPVAVARMPVDLAGATLRAVGFGRVDEASSAGKRFARGKIPVVAYTSTELETGEATCSGDSGGPAFDERTGLLVGVVSRGAMHCSSAGAHNVFTRVDAFPELLDAAIGTAQEPDGDEGHGGHGDADGDEPASGGRGGHAGHSGKGGHGGGPAKKCFGDANCPAGQTCSKSTHVCG